MTQSTLNPDEIRSFSAASDELAGKVVLVTGSTSGIGRAVALEAARLGATLVLLGRDEKALNEVYDAIEEAGGAAPAMAVMDFETASLSDMQVLAEQLTQNYGRLDGLVHCAAKLGVLTPLSQYPLDQFERVMRINAQAPFMLTQACFELLTASPSASVIFTTSTVGHEDRAYWGAYALSKGVTESLSGIWSDETKNLSQIRFNSINPGAVRTAMRVQAYPGEDPRTLKTPEQICGGFIALLSDKAIGNRAQVIDLQPK